MDAEVLEFLKSLLPILTVIGGILSLWAGVRKLNAEAEKLREETKKSAQTTIDKALDGYRKDIDMLWEQNKKTQERADRGDTALDQSNIKISQLFNSLGEAEAQIVVLNTTITERDAQIAERDVKIDKLLRDLEQRVLKNANLESEVSRLREEVNRAAPLQGRVNELTLRISHLEKQLETADIETRALLRTHEDDRRSWQKREGELTVDIKRRDEKIDELVTEVERQRAVIAELKAELDGRPVQAMTEDVLMFDHAKDTNDSAAVHGFDRDWRRSVRASSMCLGYAGASRHR